jgi:hypothetical protein
MATDDRPAVYTSSSRPMQPTNRAAAYGCLGVVAVVALLWVWGASRGPSTELDLTAHRTFSLKPGYVACVTPEALQASRSYTDVGDQVALRKFLADGSNGCGLTSVNGMRYYPERASYGVQRVRPEGGTATVYVLKEALAP